MQPFLNSLAVDVKKFCLETAVTVNNAAGQVNLLTHHGSFSETDAEAFFDNARREQITGTTAAGAAAVLIGANDADRLQQAMESFACSLFLKLQIHQYSTSRVNQ